MADITVDTAFDTLHPQNHTQMEMNRVYARRGDEKGHTSDLKALS